jgi:hypothetical protein
VLANPNLQQRLEIDTGASQYVLDVVHKQGGHPVVDHLETLSLAKLNHNKYDKEFFTLVQALKRWQHYILGKKTILHTDHQPPQFLNSQTNMGFQHSMISFSH